MSNGSKIVELCSDENKKIDLIPMIAQKLTLGANLSAFTFWIITAFFISATDIKLKGAGKGIVMGKDIMLNVTFLSQKK